MQLSTKSPESGIRKRRRPAHSCVECRRRKVRCDRANPCSQCVAHNAPSCTFTDNRRITSDHNLRESQATKQQEHRTSRIPDGSPSSNISPPTPAPSGRIHGTQSKTRVFGQGHWMSTKSLATELSILGPVMAYQTTLFQQPIDANRGLLSQKMAKCKELAREIKKQRPNRRSLPVEIHRSFPERQVIDDLVQLYFATFESCYRILHRSSFQADYERYIDHPESAKSSFVVELLLIISAAGPLHSHGETRRELAEKSISWINIAQTWLSAPLEKDRLTLKGIQIYCLLLLSRQVNRIGADLVWVSAGSLMRMAMQMGLHQDPNYLGDMDFRQKEIRRRLWYTILEMNLQAALDSGMAPMITESDYNTMPPSGIEDADLDSAVSEDRETIATSSTRQPLLCVLASSFSLRLRATRVINSLQEEPSYHLVLDLGNELASICRKAAVEISHNLSEEHISLGSQFAYSFCSHLLNRFLLCLHFNYAIQATRNPLYAHSHKVCLEVALDLISLLDYDLYSRLLVNGGGMFRDIITRGALMIYLELHKSHESDISILAKRRNRARQEPLLKDAHRVVRYAKDRMCQGETNVKGYLFLRIATARAEAMLDGLPVEQAMENAALESLNDCETILGNMSTDLSNNGGDSDAEAWRHEEIMCTPTAFDVGLGFLDDDNFSFDHLDPSIFQNLTDPSFF
ncbi:transcriptional regulator family: Fungal Specific TF [Penicillium roqueforti]|nr:transcriptional regulator family: Fungal Specific TF [Penicillium roqueforti]KAI3120689.1 transcriptional regulator family: Fungal Specific TF [Penicillium roqueforti]